MIEAITERAGEVAIDSKDMVSQNLQSLERAWLKLANEHATLNYDTERNGMVRLLREPKRGKWEVFTCLNSLRNVEPAVQLLLLDEANLGDPHTDLLDEEDQQEEGQLGEEK